MKKSKKAESLASVLIAVVLLSIVLFWVLSILNFSKDITYDLESKTDFKLLKLNSQNIVNKLNLEEIKEEEKFYIYKNEESKEYSIFTWAENEKYKYIDKEWNNIDIENFEWEIFEREFKKNKEILKYKTSPSQFSKLAFHFDASNISWNNDNSQLIDWNIINDWKNLNWNSNIKSSINNIKIKKKALWNNDMIDFSWNWKYFLESDNIITWESDCDIEAKNFEEKSFLIFFRTKDDINNKQVVLKQWNNETWYNFYIMNWEFFAEAYNTNTTTKYFCPVNNQVDFAWTSWNTHKQIKIWKILPNFNYFITIVHNSSMKNSNNEYIAEQNTFSVYQNWILIWELNNIWTQVEHKFLSIWWDTINNTNFLNAYIWELASWNYALNENEIQKLNTYLTDKWIKSDNSDIEYNTIKMDIKKNNKNNI